jgi:type III secretory pathway component EscT
MKRYLKLYLTCVALVLVTVVTIGLVLPFLFSYAATELVAMGVVVAIVYPVIAVMFTKSIYRQIQLMGNN